MQKRLAKLIAALGGRPETESLVRRAFAFAEQAHAGQKRESGEPYIEHPLAVAEILAQLEMDTTTIVAGLLHDVLEDTPVELAQIEKEFGREVALMVDGVTKLGRLPFQSKEEQQAESLRKMFLAMARDIRVIIIKLADRLHNMRTLRDLPPERQQKIARETLEIYSPISHRLGIYRLKWELEDLALRYLEPQEYYRLVQLVAKKRQEREGFIAGVTATLQDELAKNKIKAEIEGRPKNFYSIYQKMQRQGKEFAEIYDLTAIRVIVDTVPDCYAVLGIVHKLWKPLPGRFKDYIAMPKLNLYQSLHTTVVGPKGEPFEIQIRTWEMHRIAEYGVAAHWKYKEGAGSREDNFAQKISWLRQLLEWQHEMRDADDFLETLKVDLFEDEVFVFTPKGDVKNLPAGSTPVDFAYSVHTDIGHHCVGAKVNGKIVPLNYTLKNGDIVEILTAKNATPSQDWLQFLKTSRARAKVRQWVKEERREESIDKGRELLEREVRKYGLDPQEVLRSERLEEVARALRTAGVEDLWASIGFGKVTAPQVLGRLLGERELLTLKNKFRAEQKAKRAQTQTSTAPAGRSVSGVRAVGMDGLLVRFSRCCNPVPGDDIVGYITRGRGISVHRRDCPNVAALLVEKGRAIEVVWVSERQDAYPVEIQVEANDRKGLLSQIVNTIAEMKTNIVSVNGRTTRDKHALIDLVVEIRDLKQMQSILGRLQKVEGVISAGRH